MTNHRPFGFLRSILFLTALAAASACTKKNSHSSPAAAPGAKAPAESGSLPLGIDASKLDELKRKLFDKIVNREPSACGKGHSLLHSVQHDSSCRASFYAVRYVARLAEAGSSEAEINEKLEQRFRAPRVPSIDVSQAPSQGAASGRVTLVEFSDYECDHCKQAQALMPKLLADYPKDLTLYYKHYPLSGHVAGLNAALGAVAADKQGKFWQYNEKVWENSDHLSPATLESVAKTIAGLDFSRWYSDVGTEEVRSHMLRDRAEGRNLEIHRTPALFINGRRYADALDVPSLKDWIDEELGR